MILFIVKIEISHSIYFIADWQTQLWSIFSSHQLIGNNRTELSTAFFIVYSTGTKTTI